MEKLTKMDEWMAAITEAKRELEETVHLHALLGEPVQKAEGAKKTELEQQRARLARQIETMRANVKKLEEDFTQLSIDQAGHVVEFDMDGYIRQAARDKQTPAVKLWR